MKDARKSKLSFCDFQNNCYCVQLAWMPGITPLSTFENTKKKIGNHWDTDDMTEVLVTSSIIEEPRSPSSYLASSM